MPIWLELPSRADVLEVQIGNWAERIDLSFEHPGKDWEFLPGDV